MEAPSANPQYTENVKQALDILRVAVQKFHSLELEQTTAFQDACTQFSLPPEQKQPGFQEQRLADYNKLLIEKAQLIEALYAGVMPLFAESDVAHSVLIDLKALSARAREALSSGNKLAMSSVLLPPQANKGDPNLLEILITHLERCL